MRKKLMALTALVCMMVLLVCIPQAVVNAKQQETRNDFSGEVGLLRQEDDRYVFQVTVGNTGEDFSGIVQVVFASAESETCAYNTQVTLPAQSQKQFTINVPLASVDPVRGICNVNFREMNGVVLQTVSLKNILGTSVFGIPVGVLSDDVTSLTYMDLQGENLYVRNMEYPVDMIELNADNLKGYLDGLYFLIIDHFNVASLGQENITAIQDWVKNGGWLIVGTGDYAEQTIGGFDADFLELSVPAVHKPGESSQVVRDFTAGAAYYVYRDCGIDFSQMAVADLQDSYQNVFYYESGEHPALCAPLGDGAVLVLKISLGEEEMKKSDVNVGIMLYDEVMNTSNSINNYMYDNMGYIGRKAMSVIDHNSTDVDFTWLKVVIGIYVVLAGPVLYLILRKCKKSEWYWIGVPLLGLLFIGGVFVFGQGIRVNETRVYSVTTQRSGSSRIKTHYEAYRSGLDEWKILLGDSYDIGGADYNDGGYGGYFNGEYHYVVQNDSDGLSIGLNPSENFESAYFFAGGKTERSMGNITGEHLQVDTLAGTFSGTITNDSESDLKYLGIMNKSQIIIISDVKAGETVDVSQAAKDGRIVDQESASYYSDLLYSVVDKLRYNYVSQSLNKEVEKADLAALTVGLIEGQSELNGQEGKVVIVGLVENYPETVAGKCNEQAYGCLYNVLDLEVEENAAN